MSDTQTQRPCVHKLDSAHENAFDYARESLKMDHEAAVAYADANEVKWAIADEDVCSGCVDYPVTEVK